MRFQGLGRARHGGCQHDVLGLDVPVDDACGVGRGQSAKHLFSEGQRGPQSEAAQARKLGAKIGAGHILHDEVGPRPFGRSPHAAVVDGHDVRAGKPRGCACLAVEAFGEVGVCAQVRVHELDGDVALEALVAGAINGGHPAAPDEGRDGVTSVDY